MVYQPQSHAPKGTSLNLQRTQVITLMVIKTKFVFSPFTSDYIGYALYTVLVGVIDSSSRLITAIVMAKCVVSAVLSA